MTWLAPGALLAAGLAALAVIAAHFVSWRRPREVVLPTARFVPVEQPPAAARTRALSDVLLLAARLLLVLLIGLAAAGPVRPASAGSVKRVVVVDASGAAADAAAVRDSALAWVRDGDVLLVADTTVRSVPREALADALAADTASRDSSAAPGRGLDLTAALLAAQREAARLHGSADSIALVIVGAVQAARTDAATDSVRASWPGRIELVELAGRADSSVPNVTVFAEADDPIVVAVEGVAGVTVRGARGAEGSGSLSEATSAAAITEAARGPQPYVRVVRGALTAADSAFARRAGATLVHWPRGAANAALPARPSPDSTGALAVSGHLVIAPFARVRRAPAGIAVAHWVDGEPAATERSLGDGCLRTVAVEIAEAGDLVLRPAFHRVARELLRPCGAAPGSPVTPAQLASLRRDGPLAPAGAFAIRGRSARSTLAPWLWGAALVLALGLAFVEALLDPRRRGVPRTA